MGHFLIARVRIYSYTNLEEFKGLDYILRLVLILFTRFGFFTESGKIRMALAEVDKDDRHGFHYLLSSCLFIRFHKNTKMLLRSR